MAIEIYSNKDENELMVSFGIDENGQSYDEETFLYIPCVDSWIDVNRIENESIKIRAILISDNLIESYILNLGDK